MSFEFPCRKCCISCLLESDNIYKMYGCFFVMKKDCKILSRKINKTESFRAKNSSYGSFVLVILVGAIMAAGVLMKLFLGADIDSDWFWFLAGVGLAVEGVISFRRQRKFDMKYKIIRRGE